VVIVAQKAGWATTKEFLFRQKLLVNLEAGTKADKPVILLFHIREGLKRKAFQKFFWRRIQK